MFNAVKKALQAVLGTTTFSGLNYGHDTVATAGTAEALNGGTSLTVPKGAILKVKALSGNTDLVYVGDSGVSSANGYELNAGEEVRLKVDDVATVYIDVAVNGEGVCWIVEG